MNRWRSWLLVGLWVLGVAAAPVAGAAASTARVVADPLSNAACLACHDSKKAKIEAPRALASVDSRKYARSIHGELRCVACHSEIQDAKAPHAKAEGRKVAGCVSCHEALLRSAREAHGGRLPEGSRLADVMRNAQDYRQSFHAGLDEDNPGKAKASCEDCHSSHEFAVPPAGSERRTAWHKEIPGACGAKCHEDQLEAYAASVHGEAVLEKGDPQAAVCTDCHTAHRVSNTSGEKFKLANVDQCGDCHRQEIKSYAATYHGQVNRLGYTYTARCSDCHGSHGIRSAEDPKSKVHPKNRMKTCASCHNDQKPGMHDATAGFASFGPHAHGHDFQKYPQMTVATALMSGLLIFVFAFFWLHSGLWYWREWKDRKEGKTVQWVDTAGLQLDERLHVRRFALGWRIGHLVFALVTMTLVLTGTTALFSQSFWAPWVAKLFGGPKMLGLVHRVCATLFVGIFLTHFVYVMHKLLRDRRFRWFGPDSLIPNWKDFRDCWAMFKWFVGKGPRPLFDRWAYFEKFDYWAVFWGVNIIGWSGLMLAFPHVTARYLPGWVFNVATLVHGEEAFLAAVFLFTVHFFNNHFRPDKLPPPDVVMFTGTQSLEEFRRDHPAHYLRLVESGEIHQLLVPAPARALHRGSVVLGLTLIGVGLVLLVMVVIGFLGG